MNFVEGAFSVTLNAIGFAKSTNNFGGLPKMECQIKFYETVISNGKLVMAKRSNYS